MLKKFYQLVLVAAVVGAASSCADKNAYTITGTVADENLKMAYLNVIGDDWGGKPVVIDSAIVENGKFEFKGIADSTLMKVINFAESADAKRILAVPVMVEPGVISIYASRDSLGVSGTVNNDKFQEVTTKKATMDPNSKEFGEYVTSVITSGVPKELSTVLYLTNKKVIREAGLVEQVIPTFTNSFLASEEGQRAQNIVSIEDGKPYIDLKAKTPAGEDIALSSFVGGNNKYTLVDFWASWCPPCRTEMPELAAIYKEYKDKGFEIVGVSIDDNKDNWVKAIEELGITWPQMSDLAQPSQLGTQYAIEFIPYTVLIDGEGKIVKKHIGSKELREELATLLP